jgi:hypothetical protein
MGGFVDVVADREGRHLVRDRAVDPREPGMHQSGHRGWEVRRFDRQRQIGTIDAISLQPKTVQPRRPGMRDRPPGDPGQTGLAGQDHPRNFSVQLL